MSTTLIQGRSGCCRALYFEHLCPGCQQYVSQQQAAAAANAEWNDTWRFLRNERLAAREGTALRAAAINNLLPAEDAGELAAADRPLANVFRPVADVAAALAANASPTFRPR